VTDEGVELCRVFLSMLLKIEAIDSQLFLRVYTNIVVRSLVNKTIAP
jgi:hypothetical protein